MQCKIVLCEGKYDRCFIEEFLSGEIYYTNEMKKFLELIRSFGESENTVLILESEGKEGLYKKVGDLVSKLRGSSFNAILMLDQDGGDTFSEVKRRIEEFINMNAMSLSLPLPRAGFVVKAGFTGYLIC